MTNARLSHVSEPQQLRAAVHDRYAAVASEPDAPHAFRVGYQFAEALPLPDASIEWVVANGNLNRLPDTSAVLAEVARVRKPAGRLILAGTTLRHPLPPGGASSLKDGFT